MKKHILRLSVILLALALAIPQGVHAQRDTDGGIFWEVSGNGLTRPSYLFGTYHLLSGAYLKKLPRVEAAFEGASGVVVESEIDSSKIVQMFSMLVMKDKKLSDLVSEDDYQLVADEIQKSTSWRLKLVLITTGTPVSRPNASMTA